eukprot:7303401-Alexandrium_andersonii.AAC.1
MTEKDAVQRVAGIPWQAFRKEHLFTLRKLGCRVQARSLAAASVAARARNALATATSFGCARDVVKNAREQA